MCACHLPAFDTVADEINSIQTFQAALAIIKLAAVASFYCLPAFDKILFSPHTCIFRAGTNQW